MSNDQRLGWRVDNKVALDDVEFVERNELQVTRNLGGKKKKKKSKTTMMSKKKSSKNSMDSSKGHKSTSSSKSSKGRKSTKSSVTVSNFLALLNWIWCPYLVFS